MGLFRRKKKEEEVIDNRTKIEKSFEEKGQEYGRKTGELVQKGVNKFDGVKQKYEDDGTIDKIKDITNKVDDKIDEVVTKVTEKTKKVVNKVKKTKNEPENEFYE